MPRNAGCQAAPANPAANNVTFTTESQKAEYLLQTHDGKHAKVQLRGEANGDSLQITVNGKAVELSDTEKRMIQRHQDRINAILMEAAERSSTKP